jgi:hypothetical protein
MVNPKTLSQETLNRYLKSGKWHRKILSDCHHGVEKNAEDRSVKNYWNIFAADDAIFTHF